VSVFRNYACRFHSNFESKDLDEKRPTEYKGFMATKLDDLMAGLDEVDAFLAGETAGYDVSLPTGRREKHPEAKDTARPSSGNAVKLTKRRKLVECLNHRVSFH
jgi:hypothetical protein